MFSNVLINVLEAAVLLQRLEYSGDAHMHTQAEQKKIIPVFHHLLHRRSENVKESVIKITISTDKQVDYNVILYEFIH